MALSMRRWRSAIVALSTRQIQNLRLPGKDLQGRRDLGFGSLNIPTLQEADRAFVVPEGLLRALGRGC